MFSSTTTELSINRDSTRARPPSTMVLIVLPNALSRQERRQAGDRDRQQHGNGSAQRAEEHQDHHRRQNQAHAALAQHVGNGNLHVLRLVEHHGRDQSLGMSSRLLMRSRTPLTI